VNGRAERSPVLNKNKPCAEVTIRNRKGLHARASAKFVKCAEAFDATVRVARDGQTVGGTSIMGLMMLAAGPGAVITIEAEGPEAPEAIEALVALVESGFGEEN
jgi:phosphocarrier protein HPr